MESRKKNLELMEKVDSLSHNDRLRLQHKKDLSSSEKQDIPGKIIKLAKADHVIWKKRLVDVAMGRLKIDSTQLARADSCRLGKWYYGPDAEIYRSHPTFKRMEAPHKKVHDSGIRAVELFSVHKYAEAHECIDKVEAASVQVLECLCELV